MDDVQNHRLHGVLERWMSAALPFLRIGAGDPFRKDPIGMAVFLFDTEWGASALDETRELLDVVQETPQFYLRNGPPQGDDQREAQSHEFYAKGIIGAFGLRYLQESVGEDFAPQVYATHYADLEEFLYRFDAIRIRTTMELWNVDAEATPVALPSGIVIRPLTDDERQQSREESRNSPPGQFPGDLERVPTPGLLIEFERTVGEWGSGDAPKPFAVQFGTYWEVPQIGRRVLLALRLLHDGDHVRLGLRRVSSDNALVQVPPTIEMHRPRFSSRFVANPFDPDEPAPTYRLPADDLPRLSNLYAFLETTEGVRRQLDVAIRRFEMAFDREGPVDRFIDLWIVLEALFSPGGIESPYRMHQYIAQYLGADARDRWDIYSKAKESSKARNGILHGNRHLGARELHEHADPVEDYARRSLLKSIEANAKPDKNGLERDIFMQGVPVEPV